MSTKKQWSNENNFANIIDMANKKTHTVGARVDEQTYNLLEFIAKSKRWTVSNLIGEMIEERLMKEGYRKKEEKEPVERVKKGA